MLLFQFSSYTTVVEAERSQLVSVSEEEECVCQQVTVCGYVYISLWEPTALMGTKSRPYEFGGIFETQNVF